ncbi:ribosome-associated translation inhibitor RaiA [Actinospica durhamensis]|uniref:Ribosome hibernation promoting factor n=1 Tax=Actinospica durhamensis TaxID=1508375 RepID=A0A941EG37_9ACTN|nr:ribosome-associated translation inhibitor RaiA [Actinospica durhamensis]MBR7831995.1 ribosome-associated translation inhibitor RaiA [Actinospica durhamensis]
MEIVVKGRKAEVTDRFRKHVEDKLSRIERYDQKVISLDVELSKERNPRQNGRSERIELTMRGRGPVIRAEACAQDAYSALDMAVGKLEARLRRAADRRRVHHGRRTPVSVAAATSGLTDSELGGDSLPVQEEHANGHERHMVGSIEVEGDGPLVVREKTHAAPPMALDQALYEMELVGHDFFLFVDSETKLPSVVYRRRGYDYGVIRLDDAAHFSGYEAELGQAAA